MQIQIQAQIHNKGSRYHRIAEKRTEPVLAISWWCLRHSRFLFLLLLWIFFRFFFFWFYFSSAFHFTSHIALAAVQLQLSRVGNVFFIFPCSFTWTSRSPARYQLYDLRRESNCPGIFSFSFSRSSIFLTITKQPEKKRQFSTITWQPAPSRFMLKTQLKISTWLFGWAPASETESQSEFEKKKTTTSTSTSGANLYNHNCLRYRWAHNNSTINLVRFMHCIVCLFVVFRWL